MSWPQEVKACIAVWAKYILHSFRSLVHAEALKLWVLSLTCTPEGFQSRTSCMTCRPWSNGCVCSPTCMCTHVETKTQASQCLCPANTRLIFQTVSALWYRDNTLAEHYNQQAKEFTASPRITTAEKCLSLPISMSATLTSSPSSSPTLPSATFFPVFCARFCDLYECVQENYPQFVRNGCSKKKVGEKNPIK